MAESPYEAADGTNSDMSDKPKVAAQEGGSSGRTGHKSSAFRNFFKRSSSNQEGATPRSGAVSARAAAADSTHQASVSGEEEFDDHMAGSVYARSDICKFCNFPRGSSVCCPVTRRHHGTDEEMTPGRDHSRSASGGLNLISRIRRKLPLSPGRRVSPQNGDDGDVNTPQNGDLAPLALTAQPGPYDDAEYAVSGAREAPLQRDHTMSPLQPHGAAAEQNLDAYGPADSPAEEVQYYCYTDENGETVYYTSEAAGAGNDVTQAPHDASHIEGARSSDTAAGAAQEGQPTASVPEGTYVYQYVDENGETVNCLCTPQADEGAAAAEEGEGAAPADRATPATSAVTHAGSDTGNSSEAEEAATSKKKAPKAFFSAIQNVFRPRRDSRTHEDPQNMGESGGSVPSPSSDANPESGARGENGGATQSCPEANEHDGKVAAFMELLDSGEKKKFLKERKSLIKDLVSAEKKERETIAKGRQDGMAAFTRDKLSAAFAIRKDERVIKTGQKKSEPL